jgi:anaerobic magnesium-protoporphyrin IX monomethyl ester cyclase
MMTNRRPDVVFIHPSDRYENYQDLGKEISAIEPPVWCGMLAEYTRRKGFGVEIIDMDAMQYDASTVGAMVADMDPYLSVIVVHGQHPSASTQNMPSTRRICKAIKMNNLLMRILLVGGHVSALPERTLQEELCDYVCGGEGMETIRDLVKVIRSQGAPDMLHKVPDLWYRKDGEIQSPSVFAKLLKNLDEEMPTLAWDLLPMDKYRAHTWHRGWKNHDVNDKYASIYTTLGCSFKCNFCMIQAPFKSGEKAGGMKESINSYRKWSPSTVLDTMEHLVSEYGIKYLKLADEMFVLHPKHVKEICEGIVERGLNLNMWAYARVDTTKPEWLDMLAKAGITYLGFGIEGGSEKVRDDVDKGYDQEDIMPCIERTRAAGINIGANFIFGLPEDDMSTMKETYDLACKVNGEYTNAYICMQYPGSDLYSRAVRDGSPLPPEWVNYTQLGEDAMAMPTKYVSGEEVLRFRDDAFTRYYSRKEFHDHIRSRLGDAAVDHIKSTLKVKLKRKHDGR